MLWDGRETHQQHKMAKYDDVVLSDNQSCETVLLESKITDNGQLKTKTQELSCD